VAETCLRVGILIRSLFRSNSQRWSLNVAPKNVRTPPFTDWWGNAFAGWAVFGSIALKRRLGRTMTRSTVTKQTG